MLGDVKMLSLAASRVEASRLTILKDQIKQLDEVTFNDTFVYNEPLYSNDDLSTLGEEKFEFEELSQEEDLFGELVTLDDEF
jgi:hypothetical protein